MDKFKKPLKAWQWVGITAGAALFAGWLILSFSSLDMGDGAGSAEVSFPAPRNEAKVMINFGDGQKRAFQGAIIEGMSVYHALLASTTAGNLELEVAQNQEGSSVEKIDAVSNNGSRNWEYHLNGKPQDRNSLEEQLVRPGDTVEFTYE